MNNPQIQDSDTNYCDYCDREGGCHGMYAHHDECGLPERTDTAWTVGRALFDDLADRRGIKHELLRCDLEIQAQIIETMGNIATKEVLSELIKTADKYWGDAVTKELKRRKRDLKWVKI